MLHGRLLRRAGRRLVVACHSGGPDWGSGPTGKGKLYKITLHRPRTPAAGAGLAGRAARGAGRVRPAGRPGSCSATCCEQTKLTAGRVRPGRATASSRSGRATRSVQMQKAPPRGSTCRSASAQLTPDRRTLILATDPQPGGGALRADAARHGPPAAPRPSAEARSAAGRPQIDLGLRPDRVVEATLDAGRRRAAKLDRLAAAPRPRRGPDADGRQRHPRRAVEGDATAGRADAAAPSST